MINKIPTAVVGLGFGQFVAREMIVKGDGAPYFDLAAVCDADAPRVKEASEEFGVKGYTDLDELLANPDIPTITLITGPVGRAKLIDKILDAGKDVITTKPFESDAAEAERILKKAKELGRAIFINSPSSDKANDLLQIEEWAKEHKLGKLVAGRWEGWYHHVQKADGSWYDDPELCPAAPLFRLGIYGINDIVQLFDTPQELHVMESRIIGEKPTSDLAQMAIRFVDGSMMTMLAGWCMNPMRSINTLNLYFENGSITREADAGAYDNGVQLKLFLPNYGTEDPSSDLGFGVPAYSRRISGGKTNHAYPWELFHEAVSTRKNLQGHSDPYNIVKAIKIVEGMKASSLSKKPHIFSPAE
jgi:predicted dehydrogenase